MSERHTWRRQDRVKTLTLRKKALGRQPVGSPVRYPELSKGTEGLEKRSCGRQNFPGHRAPVPVLVLKLHVKEGYLNTGCIQNLLLLILYLLSNSSLLKTISFLLCSVPETLRPGTIQPGTGGLPVT